MPSDAFMELSPAEELIGESGDELYGEKTPYQMFEISSLDLEFEHEGSTPENIPVKDRSGKVIGYTPAPNKAAGKSSADDKADLKAKITIRKSIDRASPDLFRYRVDAKKKIDWAIVTVREAGESPDGKDNQPWLRLEFRVVQVTDFSWDLDPDASGEAATKLERVVFQFDTMMIYYFPQTSSGAHEQMGSRKPSCWNFATHTEAVEPIPT